MRSVGLIGGTSWRSTIEYYRRINQTINDLHGDNTNPPLLLASLNQGEIHRLQGLDRWDRIEAILLEAAIRLQGAGAEALMFCANTPHRLYEQIAAGVQVPLLHIADATGAAIRKRGLRRVGLLGTLYVMREGYIGERIRERHGVEVTIPAEADWSRIHAIIQKELALGRLEASSRRFLLDQVQELRAGGAEGVVLGCTELPLVLDEEDCGMPVFDTLRLHADMAVEFIMS